MKPSERVKREPRRIAAAGHLLVLVAVLLVSTSAASAQPPSADGFRGLRSAGIMAPRQLQRVPLAIRSSRFQQGSQSKQSWIRRHPVLFGAIVGSVAGASIVGGMVDAEASPVGFYGGGAAGALFGWVVSR